MSQPSGGNDERQETNGYPPGVPSPFHPDELFTSRSERGWVELLAAVLDALDLGVVAVRPHRHRATHAVVLANAEARCLLGMTTAGVGGNGLPAAICRWLRLAGRRQPTPLTLRVQDRRVRVRRASHLPAATGGGWVLVVESLPVVAPASVEVLRRLHGLTPTQAVVLRALLAGASDKEIGQELGSSVSAVKKHVVAIRARVGAGSRLETVAIVGASLRARGSGRE